MPSTNKIIVAAAGSGKTTYIVTSAIAFTGRKCLVVTYTLNNEEEVKAKFAEKNSCIPKNIVVKTWFSFLLEDFVRPYQNALYDQQRIEGLAFVNGVSAKFIGVDDVNRHYFSHGKDIYSDKIAKFGAETNRITNGLPIKRFQQIYDRIYVDEVQDLAAWDLDIVDILLKSEIETVLVGDPRQATYRTNNGAKYSKYAGYKILDRLREWSREDNCEMEMHNHSYRCRQEICDFADQFFPEVENTNSLNKVQTEHDGVFIVKSQDVQDYVKTFNPKILRYNRKQNCQGYSASNYKESKGLTFNRTLIFPHGPLRTLLEIGDFSALSEPSAIYVAVTRARQSVAMVFDGDCVFENFQTYSPSGCFDEIKTT